MDIDVLAVGEGDPPGLLQGGLEILEARPHGLGGLGAQIRDHEHGHDGQDGQDHQQFDEGVSPLGGPGSGMESHGCLF